MSWSAKVYRFRWPCVVSGLVGIYDCFPCMISVAGRFYQLCWMQLAVSHSSIKAARSDGLLQAFAYNLKRNRRWLTVAFMNAGHLSAAMIGLCLVSLRFAILLLATLCTALMRIQKGGMIFADVLISKEMVGETLRCRCYSKTLRRAGVLTDGPRTPGPRKSRISTPELPSVCMQRRPIAERSWVGRRKVEG